MSGIATVIEELVMATVLSPKAPLSRKNKMDWAFMALSVLLGCTGLFFLILSLERFFEERYPLDLAALFSGGVVLAVAALIGLVAYNHQHKKQLTASNAHELEGSLHALLKNIYTELEIPIQENPKMAVLVATIAGFITAQRRI